MGWWVVHCDPNRQAVSSVASGYQTIYCFYHVYYFLISLYFYKLYHKINCKNLKLSVSRLTLYTVQMIRLVNSPLRFWSDIQRITFLPHQIHYYLISHLILGLCTHANTTTRTTAKWRLCTHANTTTIVPQQYIICGLYTHANTTTIRYHSMKFTGFAFWEPIRQLGKVDGGSK